MRGEARIECHDPSSVGKARALLHARAGRKARARIPPRLRPERRRSEPFGQIDRADDLAIPGDRVAVRHARDIVGDVAAAPRLGAIDAFVPRSEEHTSELQSLMRNSYAVFCLKKKKYR